VVVNYTNTHMRYITTLQLNELLIVISMLTM